jgi:hypothetical protein
MTKCRVCKCTENHACNPPCSWARGRGNLCSSCAKLVDAIAAWSNNVAVKPNLRALIKEADVVAAGVKLLGGAKK